MHETIEATEATTATAQQADQAEASQGDAILTTELNVSNGTARIDDLVTVAGQRGRVVAFIWQPARSRIKAAFAVKVWFEANGEEQLYAASDVMLVEDAARRNEPPKAGDGGDIYPVPSDLSFGAFDVKEAGDLRQIAETLIQGTEDFTWLRGAKIGFYWLRKGGSSDGVANLGGTRKPNKFEQKETGARMVVWVAADTARDLRLSPAVMEAVVHERLCAIDKDEHGGIRRKGPDFRGYSKNIKRFGAVLPETKIAAAVLGRDTEDVRNGLLFDDDDLGVNDDD